MLRMLSSLIIFLLLQATAADWPSIEFVYLHRLQSANGVAIDPRDPVLAVCRSIPPGECCVPRRSEILAPYEDLNNIDYGATGFSALLPGQLGFGWGAPSSNYEDIRCGAGNLILRIAGPNSWPFDPRDEYGGYIIHIPGAAFAPTPHRPQDIVFAASWIDLRRRFPPNSADTRYLQWQGVRGLIWGSGRWTAESQGVPFPKRDRAHILNSQAPRGTAYLQAPRRWRHPDLYRINGTNYTDSGDGVFRAEDGRSLNMSAGARWR
ncbi:MAG: hypothetical protein Q9193_003931 [Seirophora villosa]